MKGMIMGLERTRRRAARPAAAILAVAAAVVLTSSAGAPAARTTDEKGEAMSYGEARAFLARSTEVVELTDGREARVAVCPAWQGRVMTSTCAGVEGPSFGFLNQAFIEAGKPNPHFNNYGGEERLWLSPEGGQFSLWFKPGAKQTLADWFTPPGFNEGAWPVVSRPSASSCRMATRMALENASGTRFDLEVTREVRLIGRSDFDALFGPAAGELVGREGVKLVGYETINRLANRGAPMSRDKGLVSMWILGMFNAGPGAVVIVPYRPGEVEHLGPVVKSDYFGAVPPERLKVLPRVVLFRADGRYRSKIGTSQQRVRDVAGSIDFGLGVLTLVRFTMPDDPTKHLYMNNMWEVPQAEPYVGDVMNSYNDGPSEHGEQMGAFYEIESLSPARELATGESLEHRHRTVHIQAEPAVLDALAREVLGIDLDTVRREMLRP